VARSDGQRLVLRNPRRERLAKLTGIGEWFLLPPSLFWVAFAMAVLGVWDGPMRAYQFLPGLLQVVFLIVCPLIAIAAAVVRLRVNRAVPALVRKAWRLMAFGAVFLVLTAIAMVRAT